MGRIHNLNRKVGRMGLLNLLYLTSMPTEHKNKIIDSLSPGEQNVMYNALRVKLDKKPEYTISKDEHGYYVSSDKRMFGTFRFEKKEYAELAYQIWKNMKPDEHLMYTVRGVFRLLNIDSEWTK